MKFQETDVVEIPKLKNCFIYFLIKDNEVVYVGQTIRGGSRPFEHKDKEYDKICIKYCDKQMLDKLEDEYILKYRPIYNKNCNRVIRYGIKKTIEKIKRELKIKFNLWDLKKIMNKLKIKPMEMFEYQTISVFEFYDILNYIKGEIDDTK